MADIIEYEEGYDLGGSSSDDTNPPLTFRQDAQNLIDIVEAQGMTYQDDVASIKALDLTYCPKYAYCFANDKLYEYDATSTAADDDVDVLLPSSSVGRWLTARDFSTSVAVTQQYVDDQDILLATQLVAYVDARCENGAQVNTIESISVNTVDVAPDGNKNVDITVPENTSDLNNDSNFVADATYVHTDNNYTNTEKSKLAGIAATAQVNVIETVKVNGTALSVVNKAVDITTTTGDTGDSAYEVAVAEGYSGSQTEWVASLQGADGTLWKYTAETLVIGSDVTVGDLVAPFAVNDLVISTDNNVWGIIKSVAGTDAIVTGLAAGGASGQDGSAIFFGTAVTGTGTGISAVVAGSKTGDYYKNTTTSYFYQATAADTWDYKGTDKGDDGVDGVVDPTVLTELTGSVQDTDRIPIIRAGGVYYVTAANYKAYIIP